MFALALWDSTQKRLILVRDRMGVKPLFWTQPEANTILSREIKGILASGMVSKKIDLQAHHDYLGLNYVPGPRTMSSRLGK